MNFNIFQETPTIEDMNATYNFQSLKSITFGLKTEMKDMTEIINILIEKSKQNNGHKVELYQATFNAETSEIERIPIRTDNIY